MHDVARMMVVLTNATSTTRCCMNYITFYSPLDVPGKCFLIYSTRDRDPDGSNDVTITIQLPGAVDTGSSPDEMDSTESALDHEPCFPSALRFLDQGGEWTS